MVTNGVCNSSGNKARLNNAEIIDTFNVSAPTRKNFFIKSQIEISMSYALDQR